MKVGAADSAIRHLESDFVPTTFTKSMSVDAVVMVIQIDLVGLK